jgi:hypothetical protein
MLYDVKERPLKINFRAVLVGIVILLTTIFSLVLRENVGVAPRFNTPNDDLLMVKLANQILNLGWITPDPSISQEVALSKGPGFPVYLAAIHWIPLSPVWVTHLLLLVGALVLIWALYRLRFNGMLLIAAYVGFAFFPVWFGDPISWIYREGFITAICLWIVALTVWVVAASKKIGDATKATKHVILQAVRLLLIGLLFGVLVITKPSWQGAAIFVGVVVIAALAVMKIPRQSVRTKLLAGLAATVVVLVGASSVYVTVAAVNFKKNGVFLIDNFSEGSFPRALNSWVGVNAGDKREYVLVTATQRAAVYEISPTAKKLQPYLELPVGNYWSWKKESCNQIAICDESTAWFPWELRDAAVKAGIANNPIEFEQTFRLINADIEGACASRVLDCGSKGLAPGVVPLSQLSEKAVIDALSFNVKTLLSLDGGYANTRHGLGVDPLWSATINDLPDTSVTVQKYQDDDSFMGDTLSLLRLIYGAIFILLVLAGILGVFRSITRRPYLRNDFTQITLALASWAAVMIMLGQLAILEASSGGFHFGSVMYVIPCYPFVFVATIAGIQGLLTKEDHKVLSSSFE